MTCSSPPGPARPVGMSAAWSSGRSQQYLFTARGVKRRCSHRGRARLVAAVPEASSAIVVCIAQSAGRARVARRLRTRVVRRPLAAAAAPVDALPPGPATLLLLPVGRRRRRRVGASASSAEVEADAAKVDVAQGAEGGQRHLKIGIGRGQPRSSTLRRGTSAHTPCSGARTRLHAQQRVRLLAPRPALAARRPVNEPGAVAVEVALKPRMRPWRRRGRPRRLQCVRCLPVRGWLCVAWLWLPLCLLAVHD